MKYCPAGHYCFLGFMGITKSMLNYFFKITKQNNRQPIKQKTYISKKSIIVVIKYDIKYKYKIILLSLIAPLRGIILIYHRTIMHSNSN